MLCLVTGATGYIGGRLVPELLAAGHEVRVLARHPERLVDRTWVNDVQVVSGDAGDPDAVRAALKGVDVAYYLMHSLMAGDGFDDVEVVLARIFGTTARDEGVRRIVYLGGLQPAEAPASLSDHMSSRRDVGEILRASGVPTAELRAAVIIGSGSASFEMIRYLTERLPFMITPKWLRMPTQPIAMRDILYYLVQAADAAAGGQPHVRHRRARRHDVRGNDPGLREGGRAPEADHRRRADPDAAPVEPLGRTDHAGADASWPARSWRACRRRRCAPSTTSSATSPTRSTASSPTSAPSSSPS